MEDGLVKNSPHAPFLPSAWASHGHDAVPRLEPDLSSCWLHERRRCEGHVSPFCNKLLERQIFISAQIKIWFQMVYPDRCEAQCKEVCKGPCTELVPRGLDKSVALHNPFCSEGFLARILPRAGPLGTLVCSKERLANCLQGLRQPLQGRPQHSFCTLLAGDTKVATRAKK